ncbi:hypothetical protein TRFO_02459 [Tritrichomonas foetus]|uniref:PH domain-containing protein n=1 Tax=Tritrichomonas foetus TaxID=1144522 RepID=A0A1J4J6T4_9EUKA|nr:hypothetical protein TRFO_02459 [Tritrichomonas foetus]|eukprot:OHS93895.1 hypothetical protein TRFO_02459 [Tritrichomonas foetus]
MDNKEYLQFLLGGGPAQQAICLAENDTLTIPESQRRTTDFNIISKNVVFSRKSNHVICNIDNVNITFNHSIDSQTMSKMKELLFIPQSLNLSIQKLSIQTESESESPINTQVSFQSCVKVNTMHRSSCPAGHSFPPEDEWSLVFGCPFYYTFPSAKSFPFVIMEDDIQVTISNHKSTSLFTVLLPLYFVFYDSANSTKACGSILLTAAKIEVESSHSFSITKSGSSTIFKFSNIQVMQKWSQAALIAINAANSALEAWRGENS